MIPNSDLQFVGMEECGARVYWVQKVRDEPKSKKETHSHGAHENEKTNLLIQDDDWLKSKMECIFLEIPYVRNVVGRRLDECFVECLDRLDAKQQRMLSTLTSLYSVDIQSLFMKSQVGEFMGYT